jgi:hypothetical protein
MIVEVSYKLGRVLPGGDKVRDFEELYARNSLTESEEPKSPAEMLKECIQLCRSNTARAKMSSKPKEE